MMKYDVLLQYKKYLLSRGLRPKTAITYYHNIDNLLNGQDPFNLTENLDTLKIFESLKEIKYKSYFIQAKNALKHFCRFANINLDFKQLRFIEEAQADTKKKYRKNIKLTPSDINEIKTKIGKIKDIKLKSSYDLAIATGLRVSEVSRLNRNSSVISNDKIIFTVIVKGGNTDSVDIIKEETPILYDNLTEIINNAVLGKPLFYGTQTLQVKAKELGFKFHDLRRICAYDEYKKSKSKEQVMEKLRHSSIKNTKIYLKSVGK